MSTLPYLDAATLTALLPWDRAIDAVAAAAARVDGPPRTTVELAHGHLLLMPAEGESAVGVKVVSVAPENPARGLPRIAGLFVLFDAATLQPLAVCDGAALTSIRTPAVSAAAVRVLAGTDVHRLLVFGTGPQGEAHVHALRAVRPIQAVQLMGRDEARTAALVARLRAEGVAAEAGSPSDVAEADLVVTATTARTPVVAGALLRPDACVVAVGSHEPDAYELDPEVMRRAVRVVVEDSATALREAGDVAAAVAAGTLTAEELVQLGDALRLEPPTGISVFRSVGMGWEDLAVAEAAWRAYQDES